MTYITEQDKKFRKERQKKVDALKRLNAPKVMIEQEEMIAKMTTDEYDIFCEKQRKDWRMQCHEYAKNNSIQKTIVDEIYKSESALEYDFLIYTYNVHWLMAINPLDFITKSDFDYCLYDTFLDHAKEIYCKRYQDIHESHDKK